MPTVCDVVEEEEVTVNSEADQEMVKADLLEEAQFRSDEVLCFTLTFHCVCTLMIMYQLLYLACLSPLKQGEEQEMVKAELLDGT